MEMVLLSSLRLWYGVVEELIQHNAEVILIRYALDLTGLGHSGVSGEAMLMAFEVCTVHNLKTGNSRHCFSRSLCSSMNR